jgi:hypothetical protein
VTFPKNDISYENLIDEVKSEESTTPSSFGEAASDCWKRLRSGLEFVSVGQYYTKLYHNGRGTQSSMIGGILTIICAVIIITFSIFILVPIFNKENYNLDVKP